MELGLEGNVAIVTGAGQGIGEQIAKSLSREGVKVVINDLVMESAERVANAIKAAGGEALAIKADITDWDDVDRMVKQTVSVFGGINILVNNAGVPVQSAEGDPIAQVGFKSSDRSVWTKFIAVNLYGTMNCTKAVLDFMIKQKQGKIISIISDAGRVGEPFETAYSASKAGVIGFTKALAKEVGRYCINANCISLAATETPRREERRKALMVADGMSPEQADEEIKRRKGIIMRMYPLGRGLGRIGLPSDAANAVVFFASDAAAWITGQVLSVNGGYSMVG